MTKAFGAKKKKKHNNSKSSKKTKADKSKSANKENKTLKPEVEGDTSESNQEDGEKNEIPKMINIERGETVV